MAEILTNVLAAYVLVTVLSFRYEWITPRYVTVAMIGVIMPNLNRMELLVPEHLLEVMFCLPFTWRPFHTLSGSLVVSICPLLVLPDNRLRVFSLLALGAVSDHVIDFLLINVSRRSPEALWSSSTYYPPSPNLFRSSDRWPAAIEMSVAGVA